MIKKILLGTLLFGLIGVLVFGAVNRTIAKSETPIARGADNASVNQGDNQATPLAPRDGTGRGGQGRDAGGGNAGSHQGDCSGEQNEGTRPYEGQGSGSGQGRNQDIGQGTGQQGGKGAGRGAGGTTQGQDSLITLEGAVLSADAETLVVSGNNGETVEINGRAWRYVQEMGYTFQAQEQVRLAGFYEDGEFKVVQIVRVLGGETLEIREQNGRPYWAGRGRGGNQ